MAKKKEEVKEPVVKKPFRYLWPLVISGALLVLLVIASGSYAYYYRSRIMPHTMVAGVAVGGLTTDQARQLIADKVTAFNKESLTLSYQDKSWQVTPASLGATLQTDTAIGSAYQAGRSDSTLRNFFSKLKSVVVRRNIVVVMLPLTTQKLADLESNTLKGIGTPVTETSLQITPTTVTVVPGKGGFLLDEDALTSDIGTAFAANRTSVALRLHTVNPAITPAQADVARLQATQDIATAWTLQINSLNITISPADVATFLSGELNPTNAGLQINSARLTDYLNTQSAKISKQPVSATLAVTNGVVGITQDGAVGSALDINQTASAIAAALLASNQTSRTIAGIMQVANPAVWSGNLASLGINQLIGTGTTDFSGSPSNRVANIRTGVSNINGQLIQPGAEFSTVGALGPIDEAHGYVQGLVIVNNQTLPADGGGLCQVSTTLFRSVLNAGLPVTARTAHSYEVSYYQRGVGPGLDATIYDPSPDFKWLNDTGHAVYIQGYIIGTKLTFNLFGTSDGRTSAISGPTTISTSQPSSDPLYVNTDTLPQGTTQLIDPPVPGAKTTVTYAVTRNGQVINKQVFNSSYQAMPAQYLVGTGPAK